MTLEERIQQIRELLQEIFQLKLQLQTEYNEDLEKMGNALATARRILDRYEQAKRNAGEL